MKVSAIVSHAIFFLVIVFSTTLFAADATLEKQPPQKTPARRATLNKTDSTKIKKRTSDENAENIAAPFIPGGAAVSAPISGLDQLKDAEGSADGKDSEKGRGRGKGEGGGGIGSASGG